MMEHNFFSEKEFTCKCGCGLNNIDQSLISRLNNARLVAGVPFKITSGCRCKVHNDRIGGSKTSSHLSGLAVDIGYTDGHKMFRILSGLIAAGFNRMGIAKDFIHVDIDRSKIQSTGWTY